MKAQNWIQAAFAALAAGSVAAQTGGPNTEPVGDLLYTSLADVAVYHGLEIKADGPRLMSDRHDFQFAEGTRRAHYNGELLYLHEAPALLDEGRWAIAYADWRSLVDPLLRPRLYLPAPGPVRLVLDPGHGGSALGATNDVGLVEKRLTLEICRGVRDRLAPYDLQVMLTREGDYAVSLAERTEFASRRNADLLVSVHFNSSANPAAFGVETYVLPAARHRATSDTGDQPPDLETYPGNTFDGSSMLLAQAVHRRLVRTLRAPDRGIRKARFALLRDAVCPAVLVECGFLTHSAEAAKIGTASYRDSIATSISAGILDWLEKRNRPESPHARPASEKRSSTPDPESASAGDTGPDRGSLPDLWVEDAGRGPVRRTEQPGDPRPPETTSTSSSGGRESAPAIRTKDTESAALVDFVQSILDRPDAVHPTHRPPTNSPRHSSVDPTEADLSAPPMDASKASTAGFEPSPDAAPRDRAVLIIHR